jgi:hypothetical protein
MTWSKNPEPKSTGWYLCTVEDRGKRHVEPAYRHEYPPGNFVWSYIPYDLKVIACVKFPKPYGGEFI